MNADLPDLSADVLVVGARCAGAATALLLARRGVRVIAIDQGTYGSDTLSTHALMRGGVVQLRRWGLLPNVVASGAPPITTTVFDYGGERQSIGISARHGVDALYAPRRHVLDRLLVDAARAAGAEVRFGHRLRGLLRDEAGRVRGASIAGPGGDHAIRAAITIGADGRHSAVARLAAAPRVHQGRAAASTVFAYWPGLPCDTYQWIYERGASAGVVPTNDGLSCVFATVPATAFAETFSRDVRGGFDRVLRHLAPGLTDVTRRAPAVGFRGFAGAPGHITVAHGPGWALVGDAGYFRDPLTAHGITDALLHAELLADAVTCGTDAALRTYDLRRVALAMPVFEATEAIASFSWTLDHLRVEHKRLARAMAAGLDDALAVFDGELARPARPRARRRAHLLPA